MIRHRANQHFWAAYHALPLLIREQADASFLQLKSNERHPSLRFKQVGPYWSARVNAGYRALAVERSDGFVWFWIGTHDEYMRLIRD